MPTHEQAHLVGMANGHLLLLGATEPVGVFTELEIRVEQSDRGEDAPPVHARADVKRKGLGRITHILIHARGVAAHQLRAPMNGLQRGLVLQFMHEVRQVALGPEIIDVEKRDEIAAGVLEATITRRRRAGVGLLQ